MRYTVTKQVIEVLGVVWMPAIVCGMTKELGSYDMSNLGDPASRDDVEQWLMMHSGDFRRVTDFRADFHVSTTSGKLTFEQRAEVKRVRKILGRRATGDIATCGTCGRSWDDGKSTHLTPTPSGRCPFEYAHSAPRDEHIVHEWANGEESELAFNDAAYPSEDD